MHGTIHIVAMCLGMLTPVHALDSDPQRKTEALRDGPKDAEARIERVVQGLIPRGAFRNGPVTKARLAERMEHYKTPGVSIAVVDEGRIAWARGFGVKEWGKPAPVTERTLFQA